MQHIANLYDTVVQLLAEKRYKCNNMDAVREQAKSRVAVVVTHLDMIPSDIRNLFIGEVRTALRKNKVQSNIHFGLKECEWDQEDLKKHEATVKEFIESVPEGKDLYTLLKEKGKDDVGFLHIEEDCCKRTGQGCNHKFTEVTKTEYLKVLERFQVAAQRNV